MAVTPNPPSSLPSTSLPRPEGCVSPAGESAQQVILPSAARGPLLYFLLSTNHQPLTSISSGIRTSKKLACKLFRMNTSKTQDLKPFRMNTSKKNGVGVSIMVDQTRDEACQSRRLSRRCIYPAITSSPNRPGRHSVRASGTLRNLAATQLLARIDRFCPTV